MGEEKARNTIISIYPEISSAKQGLALLVYLDRVSDYFGISEEDVKSTFGPPARDAVTWEPNSTWFFDHEHLTKLINLLSEAK
ncbi:MAG: hypothetical protein J7K85_00315 [Anaerolineaceae bacterium]|nr:hypothetical protein [Anaerolineaceae bacterium]